MNSWNRFTILPGTAALIETPDWRCSIFVQCPDHESWRLSPLVGREGKPWFLHKMWIIFLRFFKQFNNTDFFECWNRQGIRIICQSIPCWFRILQFINFVQYSDCRDLISRNIFQGGLNWFPLGECIHMSDIDHMQKKIRFGDLFQSCLKCSHQLRRQFLNKSDCIGE